jgi:hypothetical protein
MGAIKEPVAAAAAREPRGPRRRYSRATWSQR